ncbi:hypothetical protein DFH27DRAFT_655220 [Peziza echinospora]|nr:hypothetical protein DFH27DRAFT_655220 [Peziza echinospora]
MRPGDLAWGRCLKMAPRRMPAPPAESWSREHQEWSNERTGPDSLVNGKQSVMQPVGRATQIVGILRDCGLVGDDPFHPGKVMDDGQAGVNHYCRSATWLAAVEAVGLAFAAQDAIYMVEVNNMKTELEAAKHEIVDLQKSEAVLQAHDRLFPAEEAVRLGLHGGPCEEGDAERQQRAEAKGYYIFKFWQKPKDQAAKRGIAELRIANAILETVQVERVWPDGDSEDDVTESSDEDENEDDAKEEHDDYNLC